MTPGICQQSTEDFAPKLSNVTINKKHDLLITSYINEFPRSFSRPTNKLKHRFSIQDQKFKKSNLSTASFKITIPNKRLTQRSSNITESSHA